MDTYICADDGTPVREPDMVKAWTWATDTDKKRVAYDEVAPDVAVSTVFLVMDHGFGGEPVLWETMIFGGEHDGYQDRYTSREKAVAGHAVALAMARAAADPTHPPQRPPAPQ